VVRARPASALPLALLPALAPLPARGDWIGRRVNPAGNRWPAGGAPILRPAGRGDARLKRRGSAQGPGWQPDPRLRPDSLTRWLRPC